MALMTLLATCFGFARPVEDGPGCSDGRSILLSTGSIRHLAFRRAAPKADATPDLAPVDPQSADRAPGQTIAFSTLTLERSGRVVLGGIDLILTEHRIGVLGLNGSGKSSLLKLMVGLLAPSAGRLTLDELDPCEAVVAVRGRTGFLFQNPDNQIVYPVVREDIAFGLQGRVEDVQATVDRMLARLGISDLADRLIHDLSGGERQLVALAGILARDPLTLLFDEPTSQLDLANRKRFLDVLADLPQQAIVATHDLDLVADFDRVLVVADGRIAFDGTPADAIALHRRRNG